MPFLLPQHTLAYLRAIRRSTQHLLIRNRPTSGFVTETAQRNAALTAVRNFFARKLQPFRLLTHVARYARHTCTRTCRTPEHRYRFQCRDTAELQPPSFMLMIFDFAAALTLTGLTGDRREALSKTTNHIAVYVTANTHMQRTRIRWSAIETAGPRMRLVHDGLQNVMVGGRCHHAVGCRRRSRLRWNDARCERYVDDVVIKAADAVRSIVGAQRRGIV